MAPQRRPRRAEGGAPRPTRLAGSRSDGAQRGQEPLRRRGERAKTGI
ncbi:hypothetical protein JL2886_03362 [Phaeobacter gallaeciensis]|uniref:Uncharacterized protein n=1 Tax=Phaeobacter gallaeciensis TaxID=60890 RepID=A0A1B0ZW14_9RHOB|nr:hypothetical protein JL2886_03362 [Phaeobacter gallaeciensis]